MTNLRRGSNFATGPNSESGQSLVVALVVMFALSISIAGIFDFLTSNEGQFNRDRQDQRALAIAEAGLNDGLATVTKTDPSNATPVNTILNSGSVHLDNGTFTYSAQKYQTPNCPNSLPTCWVVSSTGASPTGKVLHQLQQTIGWVVKTSSISIDETPVYGYGLFIMNPTGDVNCFKAAGATTISANVWFNGSYCPNGGVDLMPKLDNKYTVYIGGNYLGQNNTNIGSAAFKFGQATIVGICKKQNTVQICSDSPNSHVYAYPPYGTSSSPLAKPDTNAASIYTYGTANPTGATPPTVNWHDPANCTSRFLHLRQQHDDGRQSSHSDALQRQQLQLHG